MNQTATPQLFRSDINGMRAIAVLAVILFHLGIKSVPGGFLGVDMFFVISGYLISGSILRDCEGRGFFFAKFYYRRARRLFPALLATLALTLLAGMILLPPTRLYDLSVSTLFSMFSVSNVYFWLQSGYFDPEAVAKPLLHTWSLGVEEQFYLFWPLIVVIAYRFGRNQGVFVTVLLLFALSLASAEYAIRFWPNAAFYLTPFRIFEFAIGALVLFVERRWPARGRWADIAVAIAVATLLTSFVLFDEKTPIQGILALPVVGATALIIEVGQTRYMRYLFANPVSEFLGRISYSLYLVHWPVVVLFTYWAFREPSGIEKAGLFAVTIILGFGLHTLVEQRFRYHEFLGHGRLESKIGATASVLVVATTSLAVVLGSGWAWRSSTFMEHGFVERQLDARYTLIRELCDKRGWDHCWDVVPTDSKKVLVIGDSHAPDGLNIAWQTLGSEYLILNSLPGCPPFPMNSVLTRMKIPDRENCLRLNRARVEKSYLARFDVIVVSVLWAWYKPEHLKEFLDYVRLVNRNAKVVVFANYIVLKRLCSEIAEKYSMDQCFKMPFVDSRFLYEDELRKLVESYGYLFVSKRDLLCSADGQCQLYADNQKRIPFTWDKHHLSYEFALRVGELSRGAIREYVFGP